MSQKDDVCRTFAGKRIAGCPHALNVDCRTLNQVYLVPFDGPKKLKMVDGREVEADGAAVCPACQAMDVDPFEYPWVATISRFVGPVEMLN